MQVENYIIILGLAKHADSVDIHYRILPQAAEASIVIRDAARATVKRFDKLHPTEDGHLSFSTQGFAAGTYTCTSVIGIQEGISVAFEVG